MHDIMTDPQRVLDSAQPIDDIVAGSPGWWSGNSIALRSLDPVGFVKVPRAHAHLIRFGNNHVHLRERLGHLALGPRAAALGDHVLVQEDLSHRWQVGTFTRVEQRDLVPRIVELHRQVGAHVEGLTHVDAPGQLRALRHAMADLALISAPETVTTERLIAEIGAKIDSGMDRVAFLGDASCSNLLIERDGTGLLATGGTMAVAADPMQVVGALIAELSPYLASAEEVFELYWGRHDSELLARANVYAMIEDVKWMYVSRIAAADRFTPAFNSSVYSMVRARRLELWTRQGDYLQWMERIGA